jgi:drug/metabolite transporter (DMT)-like permease
MTTLTRRQLAALVLLTLIWGLNWPVMKLGVSGTPAHPLAFPPLSFRALSMLFSLPVLAFALHRMKVPLALPRSQWWPSFQLALPNMIYWHVVVILAVRSLSSGRAAILGYSMPIFSALWGLLVFGERFSLRQAAGVAAAGLGIVLLLANEFNRLSGAPLAALAMISAAAVFAYGTHMLRRAKLTVPLLTLVFWMTAITAALLSAGALVFERRSWFAPPAAVNWAIAYNAIGVFGFAHAAWFSLARSLPPVASSISVMLIPVLGTFSGAWALDEALHWQDFAAMGLMVFAIAAVLVPRGGTGR